MNSPIRQEKYFIYLMKYNEPYEQDKYFMKHEVDEVLLYCGEDVYFTDLVKYLSKGIRQGRVEGWGLCVFMDMMNKMNKYWKDKGKD